MKKRKIIGRFLLSILLIVALYAVGSGVLDRMYAKEQKEAKTGDRIVLDDGWIDVEKIANQQEVGQVVDRELFFLLAGVDLNDGETSSYSRSDTMMLIKANFDTGDIDLISLPRDSRVSVDGTMTKLNHSHSKGGIDLTIQTIRDWLNVDLDYYVQMDFQAVKDIVDGIGGIDYTVPKGVNFEFEGVTIKEGPQHMNGADALAYLRHRKGYAEGDLGRVKAQQEFLKVLLKEAISPDKITSIPSYVRTYFDRVTTNIPWNLIVGMLTKVGNLHTDSLHTKIIPGEGMYIGDVSYYVVDEEKTQKMIEDTLSNYVLLDVTGDAQ